MSLSPPLAKGPCSNCRASHQKCDKRQPVCKRCENKGLDCKPVQKKAVFRHGSTANLDASFAQEQTWVNSKPKNWRSTKNPTSSKGASRVPATPVWQPGDHSGSSPAGPGELVDDHQEVLSSLDSVPVSSSGQNDAILGTPPHNLSILDLSSPGISSISSPLHTEDRGTYAGLELSHRWPGTHPVNQSLTSGNESGVDDTSFPSSSNQLVVSAFGSIQEACLLRYFIEELSSWFDHCDDRRHFQLVVPRRAQHCETLRNALFAVSSRHLCRLPQYKTRNGILYRGQLLPHLKKSSALEYMLKCIPGLAEFPSIQDPVHQENIMAATVILRQYEEMEDSDEGKIGAEYYDDERVNFLAVTQKIIDSMIASPLDHSLATAAYWIAIRQEIYYALTREAIPHLRFDSDRWRNASMANNMIMFVGEVAKWCWGQKLPGEWAHLKLEEQKIIHDSVGVIEPILEVKADRAKGQIFPTVWYSFDVQATAVQHFQLGQMILTAENPNLENATRAAHRKAEARVRSIVLNLCGIALHHLQVQPCMINAVIAITLYGEYFTDRDERKALIGIINRTNDIHAWPMRKPYRTLLRRWEMSDSVEV